MHCTLVKRFTHLFKVRITEAELELKSGNSFTSLTFLFKVLRTIVDMSVVYYLLSLLFVLFCLKS